MAKKLTKAQIDEILFAMQKVRDIRNKLEILPKELEMWVKCLKRYGINE